MQHTKILEIIRIILVVDLFQVKIHVTYYVHMSLATIRLPVEAIASHVVLEILVEALQSSLRMVVEIDDTHFPIIHFEPKHSDLTQVFGLLVHTVALVAVVLVQFKLTYLETLGYVDRTAILCPLFSATSHV